MSYTIEELVDKVNSIVDSNGVEDGRVSNVLSVRRVRDYQSKGLLREPTRVKRKSYYDDEHVKQLIVLRSMQSTGLSDSFMQKLSSTSPLYYQTAEVQEKVSSYVATASLVSSSSTDDSSLSMKDKAFAALNKCAVNSSNQQNQDLQKASASLAYTSIGSVVGSSIDSKSRSMSSKLEVLNQIQAEKKKKEDEDFFNNMLMQDFVVDPEKEKEHAKRYEESLRKPHSVDMYHVHEKVSLEVKTPYMLTNEDKSKIIERLKDIINKL